MQTIDEHKKQIQILYPGSHNFKFKLIKYPKNPDETAIYQCIACHFFEMKPELFLQKKQCPICEINDNINRNSNEYNMYLKEAKKHNDGFCELTNDESIAVHHLYSIRKYPELAYHSDNSILLKKQLHKEDHRKFSPYETNGHTFLVWLQHDAEKLGVSKKAIRHLSKKIIKLMETLEGEIARNRYVNKEKFMPKKLKTYVIDSEKLLQMKYKANIIVKNLQHLDTMEISHNSIFLMKMYNDAYIIYRNEFGNLKEFNPISNTIPKKVYKVITN